MEDNTQARRWFLTINNPEKTDEEYLEYIQDLEHFKYTAFQREKGEEKGTIHIQAFVVFSIGKRFSTIKNYFPTAHIELVKGSNVQARDYCTKKETRVAGPYEIGTFAEERSRTDINLFMELIKNGAPNTELAELFPSLYLKELNKIEKIRQDALYERFKKEYRDVNVTYIYGNGGVGKSQYVANKHGLGNYYTVPAYDKSSFDYYNGEDIILLDEFDSSFKITFMNKLLDRYPLILPARYSNKIACYTKVYIIANFPLSKQYENVQNEHPELYKAFLRRIHNVIHIDDNGIVHIEKSELVSVQMDLSSIFGD